MFKIENISYRYKKADRDVLKGVSVQFEAGQINTILGPSGSGKTTLLSIMAGLDRPTSGDLFLEEQALSSMNLDEYRLKKVSMVFQAFHLFPLLTAMENVCYPMQVLGFKKLEAIEKAKSLLESVGIKDHLHKRFPSNLSGGEQQRVAIARALSTGAKLILADEPTGNLDTDNGNMVINILNDLAHNQGYCIIIVTHNLEIAENSDVVYRMSDGVLTCDDKILYR